MTRHSTGWLGSEGQDPGLLETEPRPVAFLPEKCLRQRALGLPGVKFRFCVRDSPGSVGRGQGSGSLAQKRRSRLEARSGAQAGAARVSPSVGPVP